jgi:hypothetical protein
MRIAAGPLQQASLSRLAIWWRGGGDPTFNLLRSAPGSTAKLCGDFVVDRRRFFRHDLVLRLEDLSSASSQGRCNSPTAGLLRQLISGDRVKVHSDSGA